MASNYQNSILVDAIGLLTEQFQRHERRKPFYGAHELYLKGREFSIPDLSAIRLSEQRTTTTKYLAKGTQSVGSSRACAPTASYGNSGTVDLSWTTYSVTVKTADKQFRNNYYGQVQALANDLYYAFMDLHDDVETAFVAHLEANKSGVNSGSSWLGTFDSTNDIFPIAQSNKADYFNYVRTVMRENKYKANLNLVQNVAAKAIMDYQGAQGAGNSTNLSYNYPDMTFYESSSVTSGSDYNILSYVGEDSAVGVLDWIPGANRDGYMKGDREWTTMSDMFGFFPQMAVYKLDSCADSTSTGGATQDPTQIWEISIDLSTVKAPITTSTEEAIFKFGLLAT